MLYTQNLCFLEQIRPLFNISPLLYSELPYVANETKILNYEFADYVQLFMPVGFLLL